jgi:hypothetical protein
VLKVAIAVGAGRAPAWQGWCVDALRALENVQTVVVPAARADELGDADVVVDLAGAVCGLEPRYGVWSFAPGTVTATRPFAREIAAGARTFEIALVRRAAGRAATLRTGRFPVTAWYPSTLRLAFAEAARWPALFVALLASGRDSGPPFVLRQAQDDRAHAQRDTRQGDNDDDAALGVWGTVRFWVALGRNLARAVYDELFEIVEWNVGFVAGDTRLLLAPAPLDVRWLPPPPPATLIADPFVVERDGITAMFVEAFDYRGSRGAIDALVLTAPGTVARRMRAIDAATHLSYPYPVEIDGALYLVPENCAANEVALYRCVAFPDRWERETALFPDFDGIDTTLFAHDGRWWAFCTRYSHGATVALFAFHAAAPRGPWTAHALNPVVCDVSCARPAGQPFSVDGALYRPGQDCSRSYGGGLALARIDVLTPWEYRETIVRRIDGQGLGRWNEGVHTVSIMPGALVLDGKRTYRSARKLAAALPQLVARSIGLLAQRPTPTGSIGDSPDR